MFQTTNWHLQPADGILMPSLRKYSSLAAINRKFMNKESVFQNLKWSIQALGLPASRQIKAYPDFVVVTDELLLEFANWKEVVVGNFKNELTEQQIDRLQQLYDLTDNFPEFNLETPYFELLNNSKFFDELRTKAQQVLLEFNWKLDDPPIDRATYIEA